jgi:hypothetical protein
MLQLPLSQGKIPIRKLLLAQAGNGYFGYDRFFKHAIRSVVYTGHSNPCLGMKLFNRELSQASILSTAFKRSSHLFVLLNRRLTK